MEGDDIPGRLMDWFEEAVRDLPWRNTDDPYRIWVAEIMLQQTRVDTVVDYYHRFLERFPDVRSLAGAEQDDVLKCWEGLGYYARARWLHRAARQVVRNHDGEVPVEEDKRRDLPGIGPYTAAAIGAFAFGQDSPVVDGNVKRVLARLRGFDNPIDRTDTEARIADQLARWLEETDQPGVLSEAVMELGALICTPSGPECGSCPVRSDCRAYARGLQNHLPITGDQPERPHYEVTAGAVRRNGRILIARRPEDGMLGGLWEFPGGKQEEGETLAQTLRRELWEELNIEVTVGDKITEVDHTYSHLTITLHGYWCRIDGGTPRAREGQTWCWVGPDELEQYAFPKSNHPILRAVKRELSSV